MQPSDIEKTSFAIIDAEAGNHGLDPDHWSVVRRMIHTTADFEYIGTVRFHPDALVAGVRALTAGRPVITDTQMAAAGIRKDLVEGFGGRVMCLINDGAVVKAAKALNVTRAAAAVDAAAEMGPGGIYVIGNAPTALLRLMERIRESTASPDLVIGLPVGFVNAAESKAALAEMDVPFITNLGRKGGSNVAAAVVNAVALIASREVAVV